MGDWKDAIWKWDDIRDANGLKNNYNFWIFGSNIDHNILLIDYNKYSNRMAGSLKLDWFD